jgi:hypothetical protein
VLVLANGCGRCRFRKVLDKTLKARKRLSRKSLSRKLHQCNCSTATSPAHDHSQAAGRCAFGARRDFVGAVAGAR